MSNIPKVYQYFKVKKLNAELLLDFQNLSEFSRFATLNQLRIIFQLMDDQNEITHFATGYKGGLLIQANEGFQTLEDATNATRLSFPSAAIYYEAKEAGYESYQDFQLIKDFGIADKVLFDQIKNLGFIEGFKQHKPNVNLSEPAFANAHEMYVHAHKKGFETYASYKEITDQGFHSMQQYTLAKENGFDNPIDYEDSMEKGYVDAKEYEMGNGINAKNREDLRKYVELQKLIDMAPNCDQILLLMILSKLPQGKKVSINKLQELLNTALEEYKYPDTQQLPTWFTVAFHDRDALPKFLRNTERVLEYGDYDSDGEFFETKNLQDRKVVLDGSNVAHNSQGSKTSKPTFANILAMIKALKKKGFQDITVISDASLKHKISDKEIFPQLNEACTYLESPAEKAADMFIIEHVKRHHCLLVSNDTYREWKHLDPWVAQNIDFYRLTFMINNEEVLLPDFDEPK